jgi:AcrR family transcriptional regulator
VPARAGRRPLSRDRVLAAAVDLADAEGLEAVTMRRLAAALGVEAMSLYHHLPGKDALLDGLLDTVVAEMGTAVAARSGEAADWREALRLRCLSAREVMLRHPWVPGLMNARTTVPAGLPRHYDAILATLVEDGGFSYHLAHRALHALGTMALGFVQEPFAAGAGAADDAGTDAEVAAAMAADLPHLAAMVAAESHAGDEQVLGWCDSQAEFEFTLGLLLDGLAAAHAAETPAG